MARQNINIGTTANDGTGDKLRVAFDKVNDNFIELYELGDKGSKGDIGPQGVQGAAGTGSQGVQGATGAKGDIGAQGIQGAAGTGAQGEQGVQGSTGAKGDKGDNGSQGDQGDSGTKGDKGDTGTQGVQGAVGTKGDKGDTGSQGVQGDQGAAGAQGIQGSTGEQGVQGAQGQKGESGGGAANTANVTFQDNIVIGTGDGQNYGLYLAAGSGQVANLQYLRLRGGDDDAHIHFDTANTEAYDFYFGNDSKYVKLERGYDGNVVIGTYGNSSAKTWTFNSTGRLYLPLDASSQSAITFATNPGGGSFDQADIQFYAASGENTVLEIKNRNDTQDSIKLNASGPVRIVADGDGNIGGPYSWEFATNGAIIFPDSTVQTTAFTGAGAQGAQGVQGAAGAQGEQGAAGAQGVQGHQGVQGATGSTSTIYFLEAYANETYTLPGSFTEDVCRYSVVSSNVSVSNSWFNTSTYTFTPQKAGYWEITASYDIYRNTEASMAIKKNGGIVAAAGSFDAVAQQITKIIYLNGSTDYINIYNVGGAALSRSQYAERSWFQARWTGE